MKQFTVGLVVGALVVGAVGVAWVVVMGEGWARGEGD